VPNGKPKEEGVLVSAIKAFIIAPTIFLILIAAIFAYSGIWPPMVVVESESMQHSDTTSYIGVIDTGDIVVVKKVDTYQEVTTYVEGLANGHSTYGEPGDVIIYHRSGMPKPIIHRAMVMLEYNFTGGGFDVPSLANIPDELWNVPGGEKVWWNLKEVLVLYDVGYAGAVMEIDLATMLSYMFSNGNMHGGLITLGDHNWEVVNGTPVARYDQKWLSTMREPVMEDWIIGKARGELPWFGLLKLWATGTIPDDAPANSQRNLVIALGLLIFVPVIIDVSSTVMRRRGIEAPDWKGWLRRQRKKE
jgi:signal peptidase